MKKEISWWRWHKNENKSQGGGGTKMKKNLIVGVAQK
jgi:hypothetical protein